MLCFMLLLSASVGLTSPVIRTGFATKLKNFSHKVTTTNILSVTENVRSPTRCLVLCLKNQACVSVFYRQVSRRCQFHDVLFMSSQDGEEELGTKYYSLTAGSCPRGYIHARHLGLCYQPHLDKIPYADSLADCASRGEHIIVIDSQEKQDHVSRQILASSETQLSSYLIDGSDAETEGQWVYHDGRPMTFFAWGEGYPNNQTDNKDYLVASKLEEHFLWRDKKQAFPKYYVCQKDI